MVSTISKHLRENAKNARQMQRIVKIPLKGHNILRRAIKGNNKSIWLAFEYLFTSDFQIEF